MAGEYQADRGRRVSGYMASGHVALHVALKPCGFHIASTMVYRITVQSQLDLSSERQPGKWDMAARAQVGVPGSPRHPGEELCNPLLPSNFSLKDNGVGWPR